MGFEAVGIILGSQVMAPMMALDPPNWGVKFTVTKMERLPRGMTQSHWGWGYSPEPEKLPERFIINGVFKDGGRWNIAIDLEEKVIVHADWSNLTGDTYMGSAAIGVALFGLPGLIVTSPILLAAHGAYGIGRLATGMDRHTWTVWSKLKGQLMSEDVDVVHQAFLNHCNGVETAYVERMQAAYDAKRRAEKMAQLFENWKDDYTDGPFMTRFEHGCAEVDEVMKDYQDWLHRCSHDQNVKAYEWLGMSESEFISWYSQEKTVLQLLEERHAQVPTNPTHQG